MRRDIPWTAVGAFLLAVTLGGIGLSVRGESRIAEGMGGLREADRALSEQLLAAQKKLQSIEAAFARVTEQSAPMEGSAASASSNASGDPDAGGVKGEFPANGTGNALLPLVLEAIEEARRIDEKEQVEGMHRRQAESMAEMFRGDPGLENLMRLLGLSDAQRSLMTDCLDRAAGSVQEILYHLLKKDVPTARLHEQARRLMEDLRGQLRGFLSAEQYEKLTRKSGFDFSITEEGWQYQTPWASGMSARSVQETRE